MADDQPDRACEQPVCPRLALADRPINGGGMGQFENLRTRVSRLTRSGLSHMVLSREGDTLGANPECGVGALIMAGTGWYIGYRANLLVLQQAALVASLLTLVWAILGTEIFRVLLWPLGFLVFMLPVGTSIEPWLQDFTAWFILIALKLTGIPYLYEGYRITIPSGTWEVAPDCGGLRYLLPGLSLGYAFAALIYRQSARRLAFLAICAVTLMIANGFRAYGIIVGNHLGIAEGADHRLFSYTIYGLTIPLLYWLGLRWTERRGLLHLGIM